MWFDKHTRTHTHITMFLLFYIVWGEEKLKKKTLETHDEKRLIYVGRYRVYIGIKLIIVKILYVCV